jgi:hypothetical protein
MDYLYSYLHFVVESSFKKKLNDFCLPLSKMVDHMSLHFEKHNHDRSGIYIKFVIIGQSQNPTSLYKASSIPLMVSINCFLLISILVDSFCYSHCYRFLHTCTIFFFKIYFENEKCFNGMVIKTRLLRQ